MWNSEFHIPKNKEVGVIRKGWRGRLRIALVYPNLYRVGMASLGFQTVYALFNEIDSVVCERFFLAPQAKPYSRVRLQSSESGKPLTAFDIIAFSLSFENDYPNLLTILDTARIPLQANDRDSSYPLIIAGGVACFLNPEPLAAFIDCFLLGEAEELIPAFIAACEQTNYFNTPPVKSSQYGKKAKLRFLADSANNVPGFYAPLLYETDYKADQTIKSFHTQDSSSGAPASIIRQYSRDLNCFSTCSAIVSREAAFSNTYLIEIGRGCPHGCRFCSAGFIYRPPRFRASAHLNQNIASGMTMTDKIGLLGAAVSDLPEISQLCAYAIRNNTSLSFSSLRADAITPALTQAMRHSGVKTATIAPDAGSERMRRVINKGITETDILSATEKFVKNGILNLKLYFMVGLPTETTDDVEAIADLCLKIKAVFLESSRANKRIGEITVSLNAFTPKPFTPFQWVSMDTTRLLKSKIRRIRKRLQRIDNIRLQVNSLRHAYLQALLSRGDRRVSKILLSACKNRWNWPKTFKETPIHPDFFSLRERPQNERLPWDFIDHGISKTFLRNEYKRALQAKTTVPCPMQDCHQCGVCKK
ncbi:radical SAM protein [Desulfococcaceae bacterium HSG7]|nr:radical SAM protein [Desulfococcaceae bacterium HSG7]